MPHLKRMSIKQVHNPLSLIWGCTTQSPAKFCYWRTPSQMDVAPWCYKWMGLDGWDWISLGGVRYEAPYSANREGLNLLSPTVEFFQPLSSNSLKSCSWRLRCCWSPIQPILYVRGTHGEFDLLVEQQMEGRCPCYIDINLIYVHPSLKTLPGRREGK